MAGRVMKKVSEVTRLRNRAIAIRRSEARKKWSERDVLKGVTPAMCGPDLIPNRAGKELL